MKKQTYAFVAILVSLSTLLIVAVITGSSGFSESMSSKTDLEDSSLTCFTTYSMNEFCYTSPKIIKTGGVSKIIKSSTNMEGEIRFDNVHVGTFYHSIKSMKQIDEDDTVVAKFGDKDGYVGGTNKISKSFEISAILEKYD